MIIEFDLKMFFIKYQKIVYVLKFLNSSQNKKVEIYIKTKLKLDRDLKYYLILIFADKIFDCVFNFFDYFSKLHN